MSPPLSGYGHNPRNPSDNFINPNVTTKLTASLDGFDAKVEMNAPAFPSDGCIPMIKTDATLEIHKQGKTVGRQRFTDFESFFGPRLTANLKAPPTVTIGAIIPNQPDYQTFDYADGSGKYKHTKGDGPQSDDSKEEPVIHAVRTTSKDDVTAIVTWNAFFGNLNNGGDDWKIMIKKGERTAFSAPIEVPLREKRISGRAIECFGPIVTSLDGTGDLKVLIRYAVPVSNAAGQEDMRYFELIYHYDSASKTYKCSTQPWGSEPPHLADHNRDGTIEFITQNANLADALWRSSGSKLTSGSGGALQILQWGKKNQLIDVTNLFAADVKRHATACLVQFTDEPHNPDCYLIGYIADLCTLGEKDKALSELKDRGTPNTVAAHEQILDALKKNGYL